MKAEPDRIVALLECWAEWRGTVRQVMRLRRYPRCNLGRLVAIARQEGELWAHNQPERREIFDDDAMSEVDRAIVSIEWRLRDVLFMAYVDGRYLTPRQRARKMHISKRAYYYRLKEAHDAVSSSVDWGKVRNAV